MTTRHLITTLTVTALMLCGGALMAASDGDGARDHRKGEMREKLLEKFDTNHDGKLDDGERKAMREAIAARLKEKHPELFAKIDTNHDGKLERSELKAFREERREHHEHHEHHDGGGKLSDDIK